jgi:hypothetical protein
VCVLIKTACYSTRGMRTNGMQGIRTERSWIAEEKMDSKQNQYSSGQETSCTKWPNFAGSKHDS